MCSGDTDSLSTCFRDGQVTILSLMSTTNSYQYGVHVLASHVSTNIPGTGPAYRCLLAAPKLVANIAIKNSIAGKFELIIDTTASDFFSAAL